MWESSLYLVCMRILNLFPALMLALFMGACQSGSQQAPEGTLSDTLTVDSVIDPSAMPAPDEISPDLIGKWQTVQIRIGDLFMSTDDIELPIREFQENGTMIIHSAGAAPQTISFSYQPGSIFSEQEGEENIELLTADSLILSRTVDGDKAEYVYVKNP